jgi:hypothetical protein
MAFPGKSYTQQKDDCFRVALANLADMHPSRVPYVSPRNWYFYEKYQLWCLERLDQYLKFHQDIDPLLEKEDHWLGVVAVGKYTSHAVVMAGKKLHYDPAGVRKRKPRRFRVGITLEPYNWKKPILLDGQFA